MATAKQLAWRKEFAKRAKAGTLQRNISSKQNKDGTHSYTVTLKKRKKNPAKKTAAKKTSINRVSQITKRAPTKRLKTRRAANSKPGYFPNPVRTTSRSAYYTPRPGEFEVFKKGAGNNSNTGQQKLGTLLGRFSSRKLAVEYATAYAEAHQCTVIVVGQ